jgi:MoaA/NifB/PqqE/SkfB family radical SAM enzyme
VGVSLDGIRETHDKFRRLDGAFDARWPACAAAAMLGVKVGVRFTMTQDNAADLPGLLQLVEDEGIDRFYFSHLNYAGRGNKNRADDARHQPHPRGDGTAVRDRLGTIEAARPDKEFTTGNNDADGPYLPAMGADAAFPASAAHIEAKLMQWGGNSSGVNVPTSTTWAMSTPTPCGGTTPWAMCASAASATSGRSSDPLMAGLKRIPAGRGRCAECRYLAICNGNTRVRAQQLTGDAWAGRSGCYLASLDLSQIGA